MSFAWGAGMAAISAIVGHLGSAAVAAHSVAQVCRQLSMVIGFGISSATAIMIGKGHRREERRIWPGSMGRRFVKAVHYLRHRRSCGDPGDLAFAASVPETDPAGQKLSVCHDGYHVLLCDRSVFKQHHCSRGAPGRGRYQVRTFSGCGSYVALLYCGSGSRSLCHRNPHAVGLYPAVQRRGDQDSFLPLEI